MKFDNHMMKLTEAVHDLTTGRTSASYRIVRERLLACIRADSLIALPSIDDQAGEQQAMPCLTRGSNGFAYYVAFTSEEQLEASGSEVIISIPIVNFLALVHSNRGNPELGGIILNPGDNGGCAIVLSECIKMMEDVMGLLGHRAEEPAPHELLQ